MRLTAELIQELAEHRSNPLDERELCLAGLALPALEHLGAARDDFDAYDLSNNRLRRLENFPKVSRLQSLYCANNLLDSLDANNLQRNLPNLRHLDVSHNAVRSYAFLGDLGTACPSLESISLVGNPITRRPHYRLCVLHHLPALRMIDYSKVKLAERQQATSWAKSAAGRAVLEESVVADGADSSKVAPPTFTPGGEAFATAHFTAEQKAVIRERLANATSVQEMQEIEDSVRRGILPVESTTNKRPRTVVE
jgi:U2 small nuclear ribonucleoprotein A'